MAVDATTSARVTSLVETIYNGSANLKEFKNEFGEGERFEFEKIDENDFLVIVGDDDQGIGGSTPTVAFRIKIEDGKIKAYRSDIERDDYYKANGVKAREAVMSRAKLVPGGEQLIPLILTMTKGGNTAEDAFKTAAEDIVKHVREQYLTKIKEETNSDKKMALRKEFAEFTDRYYKVFQDRQGIDIFSTQTTFKSSSYSESSVSPENLENKLKNNASYFNVYHSNLGEAKESKVYEELKTTTIDNVKSIFAALKDDGISDEAITAAQAKIEGFINDKKGFSAQEVEELIQTLLEKDLEVKYEDKLITDDEEKKELKTAYAYLFPGETISDKDQIIRDGNNTYFIKIDPKTAKYSIKAFQVGDNGEVRKLETEPMHTIDLDAIKESLEDSPTVEPKSSNTLSEMQEMIEQELSHLTENPIERKTDIKKIEADTTARNRLIFQGIGEILDENSIKASVNSSYTSKADEQIKTLFTSIGITDTSAVSDEIEALAYLATEKDIKKRDAESKKIFETILEKLKLEKSDIPEIDENQSKIIQYFNNLVSPRAGTTVNPQVKKLVKDILMQIAMGERPSQRLISKLRDEVTLPKDFDSNINDLIETIGSPAGIEAKVFSHDKELEKAMRILNTDLAGITLKPSLDDFYELYSSDTIPSKIANNDEVKALLTKLREAGISDNQVIKDTIIQLYLHREKESNENGASSIFSAYTDSSISGTEFHFPEQSFNMKDFRERLKDPELAEEFRQFMLDENFSNDPELLSRMAVLHSYFVSKEGAKLEGIESGAKDYITVLRSFAEKNGISFSQFAPFQEAETTSSFKVKQGDIKKFLNQVELSGNQIKGDYGKLLELAHRFGILYPKNFDIDAYNQSKSAGKPLNPKFISNFKRYSTEPSSTTSQQEFFDRMDMFGYFNESTNQFDMEKLAKDLEIKINEFLKDDYASFVSRPDSLGTRATEVSSDFGTMMNILNLRDSDIRGPEKTKTIDSEELAKTVSLFIKLCNEFSQEKDLFKEDDTINLGFAPTQNKSTVFTSYVTEHFAQNTSNRDNQFNLAA